MALLPAAGAEIPGHVRGAQTEAAPGGGQGEVPLSAEALAGQGESSFIDVMSVSLVKVGYEPLFCLCNNLLPDVK